MRFELRFGSKLDSVRDYFKGGVWLLFLLKGAYVAIKGRHRLIIS